MLLFSPWFHRVLHLANTLPPSSAPIYTIATDVTFLPNLITTILWIKPVLLDPCLPSTPVLLLNLDRVGCATDTPSHSPGPGVASPWILPFSTTPSCRPLTSFAEIKDLNAACETCGLLQGVPILSRHRSQTVIGVSSFNGPVTRFSSKEPTDPVKDSLTDARLETEVVSLDLNDLHAVSEIRCQV